MRQESFGDLACHSISIRGLVLICYHSCFPCYSVSLSSPFFTTRLLESTIAGKWHQQNNLSLSMLFVKRFFQLYFEIDIDSRINCQAYLRHHPSIIKLCYFPDNMPSDDITTTISPEQFENMCHRLTANNFSYPLLQQQQIV